MRRFPDPGDGVVPGALVKHPDRPDWGVGQVQSVAGHRITANFEHTGKIVLNGQLVQLEVVDPESADSPTGADSLLKESDNPDLNPR